MPRIRSCFSFALLLALLASVPPAAAAETFDLASLMSRFAASRGVQADFAEEKHLSLLVDPLVSTGRIYFAPPKRLARHVLTPLDSRLTVVGDTLTLRTGSGVDRIDLGGSEVARHFVEGFIVLFSGDLVELERRYTVRFVADPGADLDGNGAWRMHLEPRQRVVRRMIASIELHGRGLALETMEVIETQGDRTTTRFSAIDSDHHFSDDALAALFPSTASPEADEHAPRD